MGAIGGVTVGTQVLPRRRLAGLEPSDVARWRVPRSQLLVQTVGEAKSPHRGMAVPNHVSGGAEETEAIRRVSGDPSKRRQATRETWATTSSTSWPAPAGERSRS